MELIDTFMSSPICVKILNYQCISKKFPLLRRQFFPSITLKQIIFFSQLQLVNKFFYKKGNIPPPPPIKIMVRPYESGILTTFAILRTARFTLIGKIADCRLLVLFTCNDVEPMTEKFYYLKFVQGILMSEICSGF